MVMNIVFIIIVALLIKYALYRMSLERSRHILLSSVKEDLDRDKVKEEDYDEYLFKKYAMGEFPIKEIKLLLSHDDVPMHLIVIAWNEVRCIDGVMYEIVPTIFGKHKKKIK